MTNEDLSVKLYFDLDNDEFQIEDVTDYLGDASVSAPNIAGVYKLTDPNGNILHEGTDFDSPDVDPYVSLFSVPIAFTAVEGAYTVVYSAYSSSTLVTYTKTFTFTYDADVIPDVLIDIESDVALGTIVSDDVTVYSSDITLNSRTHVLTYPSTWGSSSTTGAEIALTELYTGEYSCTITSDITITNSDDLIIDITITGTETHDVWDSDGIYVLRTALKTLYDRWVAALTSNPKEGRRLAEIYNQVNANYTLFDSARQNGDAETSSEFLNNIKVLLNAEDIDTEIDPSVSVPVIASLLGYATQWLDGSGVPSVSLGRNGDYYFRTDTSDIYKKVSGAWGSPISNTDGVDGIGVGVNPGTIIIPKDKDDVYDYTGATSQIYISIGGVDATPDFTYVKGTETNITASVNTTGEVTITNLTASYGAVQITCSKTGVDDIIVDVIVKEIADGDTAYTAFCSVSSIAIPTDSDTTNPILPLVGYPLYVYRGNVDDTVNWTFTPNNIVGADIEWGINTDELAITNAAFGIGDEQAILTIKATKAGVSDIYIAVLVYAAKAGQAVVDATSVDNSTIEYDAGTSKIRVKDGGISGSKVESAANNIFLGTNSGAAITNGSGNVCLGNGAGGAITSGNINVLVGVGAGSVGTSRSYNVAVGYNAGMFETGNSKLFLDSSVDGHGTEAAGRTASLVYGEFSATLANQLIRINGQFQLIDGLTAPSTVAGYAQIYVDVSDGDLKVKFGDGTVKVLAADT